MTWRPCSPRAIAVATAAISRSGFVVPRASSCTQPSASAIPAPAPTIDGRPEPAHGDDRRHRRDPDRRHDDDAELELQRGQRLQRPHGACDPERVADALHRAQDVGAELAPHGGDVRVDRALAGRPVGVAPDLLEQLLAAEDDARPLREAVHEVELRRREVHERAVAADLAPRGIDRDGAGDDRPRRRLLGGALDAAQQRPHARDELALAERLGHVVVGADAEPDEQVGLRVERGEHEHRHGALALDAAADLVAVDARQHDVEHDEVGADALAELDAARAVVGDLDGEALGAQAGGQRVGDRRLVLHDDDRRRRRGLLTIARMLGRAGGRGVQMVCGSCGGAVATAEPTPPPRDLACCGCRRRCDRACPHAAPRLPRPPIADRLPPQALFVLGAISQYVGAALAVLLFASVPAAGVAWLRVVAAAAVLVAWRRPWQTRWTARAPAADGGVRDRARA